MSITLQEGYLDLECPPTPNADAVRSSISAAMVCHSNVNRSMEAHHLAQKAGIQVSSYGAGSRVRLPGLTQDDPRVFEFGTPYHVMFRNLYNEDTAFYAGNGMLRMLDRDRKVKFCPQRWQEEKKIFDLVICFEQRVYEIVIDDLMKRQVESINPNGIYVPGTDIGNRGKTHVVNLETIDNHKAAKEGSEHALYLLERLYENEEEWEDRLNDVLDSMESKLNVQILHTIIII